MDRKTSMVGIVSAGGSGGNGYGSRISTPTFEATSELQTFTTSQWASRLQACLDCLRSAPLQAGAQSEEL